jgi:hypothetical protein
MDRLRWTVVLCVVFDLFTKRNGTVCLSEYFLVLALAFISCMALGTWHVSIEFTSIV